MWARPPRATRIRLAKDGISHGGRVAVPQFQVGLASLSVLFGLLLSVGTSWACETPVYRYAMYRWQPTPYEVYAFHDAAHADAHAAVEQAIAEVSEGTDNRANVVFIPVNLTTDPELNSVTPDIKQAWLAQSNPPVPSYLISTPYGVQVYAGKLDAGTVTALTESPARKQMAQQLEAGKIGVMLFLTGQDKQENEKTKAILTGLVKEVGEGKISLYTAPTGDAAGQAAANQATEGSNPALELGLIEVNREDEKEAWLVRSLLAMESDLPAETRPMVFLTYGRGRALLPYIGAGITRENLIREVEFISGACSCTVKEQNPGVDLLVRYDWEAASAALADRFGTEEGNESQFGPADFLPQLIIPSSTAPPTDSVTAAGDATSAADPSSAEPTTDDATNDDPQAADATLATAATGGVSNVVEASTTNPAAGEFADELEPTRAIVAEAPASQAPVSQAPDGAASAVPSEETSRAHDDALDSAAAVADAGESPAFESDPRELAHATSTGSARQQVATEQLKPERTYLSMAVVGGGLALGLVILFGLTFFVMRPH